eukprot:TRINITY_DN23855_c0_g1_i4.p2 TRINITY_DN23855_c0_g1~~TRINITY_DN23855_c0_g1_i4.p2  ORF type:complete len:104 (-),score=25.78 TRINITY_DN23855_c0_g1_i4:507-818(-)
MNLKEIPMEAPEEMIWMMPNHAVYVNGLSFARPLEEDCHLQLLLSADGVDWHCVLDSKLHEGMGQKAMPCRFKTCVRWLKLQVVHGSYNNFMHIHGILVTGLR